MVLDTYFLLLGHLLYFMDDLGDLIDILVNT